MILRTIFYYNKKITTLNNYNYFNLYNNKINYRYYYSESFENKEKELELEKKTSQDKEKLYLIKLLEKIESQNNILLHNIKKININIENIKNINQIKKND